MADPGTENIKGFGWRQGSALPPELIGKLISENYIPDVNEDEGYFVISQDCDVVNRSLTAEPYCEILRFQKVQREQGNFMDGKNPRKLQFKTSDSDIYECSVHDKECIPRNLLNGFRPLETISLTPKIVRTVRLWLAKRYSRESFPDAFNDRCRAVNDPIKKQLKARGEYFEAIYLTIDSMEELSEDKSYEITLVGCLHLDIEEGDERYLQAESCMATVSKLLESCSGIDVTDQRLESKETITLADLDFLKPWDVWGPQ
ncbi:hypothetical protein [Deinococcus radiophilus]|uniref:hypothetical protein n=1 Tax=Deinococcus radiophilus TaxID=32062 RepID=UPI001E5CECDD|nr:hypothetical protein [Deinococcus radiophilus]UFA49670.1 hypothetical protein LMT64_07125 [Deinococcus radiophilus]